MQANPDLFLQAAVQAARRGVKVRVLLGDAFLDPADPKDNTHTVKYLNELAQKEGLDMQARLVDSKTAALDKVHNKAVLVDGRKAFISSINWSHNSPANNREAGLIIDHPAVGAYFTDIFTYDWYNGTPADYPLLTEVHAGLGYVEVSALGPRTADVGGWLLTAAAGQWRIPDKTLIFPAKPLVLVKDAKAFKQRFSGASNVVEVPGLALGGAKDSLSLRRGNQTVDAVAWGNAELGWKLPEASRNPLCRPVPGKDTNTYLDWGPGKTATPGVAGCGSGN